MPTISDVASHDVASHDIPCYHIEQGRLSPCTWLASPNVNQRPPHSSEPDTIVIHNISLPPGEFGASNPQGLHQVKALFTNQLDWQAHPYFTSITGIEVSAHLLIERTGEVTQFVNFRDRAWHAGVSAYLGRTQCNDFSIGIELEGSDHQPFTEVQYQVLAHVIQALYQAYPKTRRHLVGHSDIARGRKSDPGEHFDWQKLRTAVATLRAE